MAEMKGEPKASKSKKIESIDDLFKDFERDYSDSKSEFNVYEALEAHDENLNKKTTELASAKATFQVAKIDINDPLAELTTDLMAKNPDSKNNSTLSIKNYEKYLAENETPENFSARNQAQKNVDSTLNQINSAKTPFEKMQTWLAHALAQVSLAAANAALDPRNSDLQQKVKQAQENLENFKSTFSKVYALQNEFKNTTDIDKKSDIQLKIDKAVLEQAKAIHAINPTAETAAFLNKAASKIENLTAVEKSRPKEASTFVEQAAIPTQKVIVPREVRIALIEISRSPEQFFQNNNDVAKWEEIKRNIFPSLTDASDSKVVGKFLSSPIKITLEESEKLHQFLEPIQKQRKNDREVEQFVSGLSTQEIDEIMAVDAKDTNANQNPPVQRVKLEAQELGKASMRTVQVNFPEVELASAKASVQVATGLEKPAVQKINIGDEMGLANSNTQEFEFSSGFDNVFEGITGNVIDAKNTEKTKKNFKDSLKNALKSPNSKLRHYAMPQIVPSIKPEQDDRIKKAYDSAKLVDGSINIGLSEATKISVSATIGKKTQILNTYEFVPEALKEQKVEDRKYVINFNGNAEFAADKITSSVDEANKLGYVAIAFDYPGVMNDGAKAKNTKQLVEAGKAQVQQLLDQGVPASSIVLDGHSMGGAVATLVAAHFHDQKPPQQVFLINDRSFSKLSTITEIKMTESSGSTLLGKMAGAAIKATGLEMNAKKAYNSIPDTHKMFVVAEKDDMIPWQGSLAKSVTPNQDRKRVQWEEALRDCDHDDNINTKKNGLGKSGEQLREAFFDKAGFKNKEEQKQAPVKVQKEDKKSENANVLDLPNVKLITPMMSQHRQNASRLNRTAPLNELDTNVNRQLPSTRPRGNST